MTTESTAPAPSQPLIDEERQDDIVVASGKPAEELRQSEKKPEPRNAPRNESNLKEGLEDSMAGSDPVSTVQP